MKRKVQISILFLFVNILLIGLVKYFMIKDTIQTQESHLNFFSQNLSLQKNNITLSYRNSASLMYSQMIHDSTLIGLLNSIPEADSIKFSKIQLNLTKLTLPYYNNLNKIGFSSFIFILKNSATYLIFDTKDGNCIKSTPEALKILHSNFENIPLSGANIINGLVGYHYIFPVISNNNGKPISYILIGFDFQRMNKLLSANLPDSKIGFLFYPSNKTLINSIEPNRFFKKTNIADNIYTDEDFERNINSRLPEKDRKHITSLMVNASKNKEPDHFSIYFNSKNRELLSFSELNLLSNEGKLFVVSACTDHVLIKTRELNDRLFYAYFLILFLVMISIIFLYLNRINILKEKINIENSELKLKELNQSKDKFFSILAHDLKNPFNGIIGMSGYLTESYSDIDDTERKEIINDINIASKNAFNLLQNLLEWTRTQSGQIKNVPVKIEPKNIIDLSLETVLNLAKDKEIEIIQIFQTDMNAYADENLVSTVLRNLFTNAVKFSSRKSKVEVIVKKFEKELVFCVKDYGIGLRSNEIDQLFRIDANFHKKGTEDETGTGLGLKICKEFVEYCKGRIWVVSEPMVGSSFFFTVPVYQ